jgi:hypothetical protein
MQLKLDYTHHYHHHGRNGAMRTHGMNARTLEDAIVFEPICSQGHSNAVRIILTKDKARELANWLLEVAG